MDLSLPQTVALRRQAYSMNHVPFLLPPGTSGLSIHPRQPGSAWWPHGDICPMKPRPQGDGAAEGGGGSIPIVAGPGKEGSFAGPFAAYVLVDGIHGSNRSGTSLSDELFLWQWRVASWLFLLGTATCKSLLPAGRIARTHPGRPVVGSCSGQPLHLGQAGTCPFRAGSSCFKAGRVSGSRQG